MNQPPSDQRPSGDMAETPADVQMELAVSVLLRIGVWASLVLVVLGTVLVYVHHPGYLSQPTELLRLITPGTAEFPDTLAGVFQGLLHYEGRSLVLVGLLLLILTPVLRVAVSVGFFLWQRDWLFSAITGLVLALLLLSFFLGAAG